MAVTPEGRYEFRSPATEPAFNPYAQLNHILGSDFHLVGFDNTLWRCGFKFKATDAPRLKFSNGEFDVIASHPSQFLLERPVFKVIARTDLSEMDPLCGLPRDGEAYNLGDESSPVEHMRHMQRLGLGESLLALMKQDTAESQACGLDHRTLPLLLIGRLALKWLTADEKYYAPLGAFECSWHDIHLAVSLCSYMGNSTDPFDRAQSMSTTSFTIYHVDDDREDRYIRIDHLGAYMLLRYGFFGGKGPLADKKMRVEPRALAEFFTFTAESTDPTNR